MLRVGKKIIVVALGGNALVQEGEKGTIQEQFANIRKSITGIVQCIKKGFDVVITHGNGPQVGNMLLRTELSRDKVTRYRSFLWEYVSQIRKVLLDI